MSNADREFYWPQYDADQPHPVMPCTVHVYTHRQGSSSHEQAGSTLITLPLIYSIVETTGLCLETVPGSGEMSEWGEGGEGCLSCV